MFAWLISHQPAVPFSKNKPATNNQKTVLFSHNKSASTISHQPNEQAQKQHHAGCEDSSRNIIKKLRCRKLDTIA
jgi:hypothetical protein